MCMVCLTLTVRPLELSNVFQKDELSSRSTCTCSSSVRSIWQCDAVRVVGHSVSSIAMYKESPRRGSDVLFLVLMKMKAMNCLAAVLRSRLIWVRILRVWCPLFHPPPLRSPPRVVVAPVALRPHAQRQGPH